MKLFTEHEIRNCYLGRETAATYIESRFASELMRLLHERQVAAVQRALTGGAEGVVHMNTDSCGAKR